MKVDMKVELLKRWRDTIVKYESHHTDLVKLFGSSYFESGFFDDVEGAFSLLTEMVAERLDTTKEVLDWFHYDTRFGDDPKEVILADGTEIMVNSFETFLETI